MTKNTPSSEEIQDKLYNNLKKSNWHIPLKGFLLSENFFIIIDKLAEFYVDGIRFTPSLKDMFNAFYQCDYKNLKTVFIINTPFRKLGSSDGIALGCSKIKNAPPHFKHFEKAIGTTIHSSDKHEINHNLEYLARQGVLLLPASFTIDAQRSSDMHIKLWRTFYNYLLDSLSKENKYSFVLVGSPADIYEPLIDNFNPKFILEDLPDKFNRITTWDCQDVFNQINKILTSKNELPIEW